MPTTYAHWRFGDDCIKTLPEQLQDAIHHHRDLYDLGVHGPDIFFYDLIHKDVSRYGSAMHHQAARGFFENCVKVLNEETEDKEAMLSYILGFLSHYTLDSQCHGYINRKDALNEGLSHNKIEAEYDAHMMKLDGRNVAMTDRAQSLRPTRKNAAVIARFFPFSGKQIYQTCFDQQFIIRGLNCRSDFKRKTLASILQRLNLPNYRDLIVPIEELPACKDSNRRLDKLRAYALELYPRLAANLMETVEGKTKLCAYFDRDFDPENENIQVLPYEEELKYIPEKDF